MFACPDVEAFYLTLEVCNYCITNRKQPWAHTTIKMGQRQKGVKHVLLLKRDVETRCSGFFQYFKLVVGDWQMWLVVSAWAHLCRHCSCAKGSDRVAISNIFFLHFSEKSRGSMTTRCRASVRCPSPPHLSHSLLRTSRKIYGDEDSCSSGRRQVWNNVKMKVYPCVSKSPALHVGEILTDLLEQRQHGNKPTSDTEPQSR